MTDPVVLLADWLRGILIGAGLPQFWISVVMSMIGVVVLATVLLVLDIFLVWLERKVVARFQDRLGPNRLGPFGLFQPFADVIKLLIKEDTTPGGADKFLYNLSPIIALATVLLLWAVLPLSPTLFGTDINVGVLYIVAVGAIATLGVIIAGWASNNKYALIGAFRSVAMMVSYEVPMVIVLLIPVIFAGSMGINHIVQAQSIWYLFLAPVAALVFFVSSIAEIGRAPFDLFEAESEIVAGYNIEYSGMKFGLFYAGELLHALTIGAIFSALFLGGWRGPGAEQVPLLGLIYFFAKAIMMYFVVMWVRYTVPRLRIDHILSFNWKFLTPLALALVICTAILDKLLAGVSPFLYWLGMVVLNGFLLYLALSAARRSARQERMQADAESAEIHSTGAATAMH